MANLIQADVLIVGSGIAGALIAAKLASSGVKVAILEAGQSIERNNIVQSFKSTWGKGSAGPYPLLPQAQFPTAATLNDWYCQSGPENFTSTYLKVVGGTTWHWLGTCLRLLPSDFGMKKLYGVGDDWPITYDILEPYYGQAESEIGVSGSSEDNLGSPRSTPYPMPPIEPTFLDQTIQKALQGTSFHVRSTPQARNSIFRDDRVACCGNASCVPICPVQAKYDATVHIAQAVKAGASLYERTTAVKLDVSADGRIEAIRFKRWDQSEGMAKAKVFVLACNGIETPRLLLASRSETMPQGVANSSDQVGRNLMDHPIQLSWALSKDPVYPFRGPIATSGIENLRDGAFRKSRGAFRIEIGNDGWAWPTGAPLSTLRELVNRNVRGDDLKTKIVDQTSRQFRLASLIEQDPDPSNRVTLDDTKRDMYGVPLPNISYKYSDYVKSGVTAAIAAHNELFEHIEASEAAHGSALFGAGHLMGTTRMGSDPTTSVVDGDLRSHDHPNLFLVGSGMFPTGGTANPTLTIAALSLRAVRTIKNSLV